MLSTLNLPNAISCVTACPSLKPTKTELLKRLQDVAGLPQLLLPHRHTTYNIYHGGVSAAAFHLQLCRRPGAKQTFLFTLMAINI